LQGFCPDPPHFQECQHTKRTIKARPGSIVEDILKRWISEFGWQHHFPRPQLSFPFKAVRGCQKKPMPASRTRFSALNSQLKKEPGDEEADPGHFFKCRLLADFISRSSL